MILHIPHSSRYIPESHLSDYTISPTEITEEQRRLTDWYTDELFHHDSATRVVFDYSRVFIDVERFEDDSLEEMTKFGMGKFYTRTLAGKQLRDITESTNSALLAIYRTHHQQLLDAVNTELKQSGNALIIDCHSFPEEPLPIGDYRADIQADICLGFDAFHQPKQIISVLTNYFQNHGLSVSHNKPYAGSIVPIDHYGKTQQVKSVMIEVNRKLYMDEGSCEKSNNFNILQKIVRDALDKTHQLEEPTNHPANGAAAFAYDHKL